ncbi:MAG TPA: Ig-like domain-containing protein [Longimicrobiales bacterium]|nr:Ig-like domain-containing protein [Longimicrobiales bacterium]
MRSVLRLLLPVALFACSDSPTALETLVASVQVSGARQLEVGHTIQLTAVARNGAGGTLRIRTFEWRSLDESVATVDANGLVTGVGPGAVVIVAETGGRQGGRSLTVHNPPRALTLVSGDEQAGKPGSELGERLVVQVTDAIGIGVAGVGVSWSVTSGDAALDGLWSACPGNATVDRDQPIRSISATTDADGFASVSLTPLTFSAVTVEAKTGSLGTVPFTIDATDPGAALVILSGDRQEDRIAGPLQIGGEPLIVQVLNGDGEPAPHIAVEWGVLTGGGTIFAFGCEFVDLTARTGVGGTTYAEFLPQVFGTSTVGITVPGIASSPQVFTIDATLLQVRLYEDPWTGSAGVFSGPRWVPDVTMPIGATVEFWNTLPEARITSTSAPPGGASFDSGTLAAGGSFRFVPDVAGVWTYHDQVTGATGTLSTLGGIIGLAYDYWLDEVVFWAVPPVPLGMAVQFRNYQPAARIVSTAAPPGGASFDSGTLAESATFVFVPAVTGTWHFVDQVSGATGSFTVR